jgi:omega-amidase
MKIAAAQIELSRDSGKNADRIKAYITNAGEKGISIVAFPETALTGYTVNAFRHHDQDRVDVLTGEIHATVKQTGVAAVVGLPYREDGTLYNSAVVLLPDGNRMLYHKRYLVGFEEEIFTPGKQNLVFPHDGLSIGVVICRDQNFPMLFAELKQSGADVVFILSAHYYKPTEARWKLDKNIALPIARATENGLYVCKANAVGTIPGKVNLGHSLIVGPNGVVLARAGESSEAFLSFDIDITTKDWSW